MPLTSYTPAEILLTERRRLELPLLLLIWLGAAAFSLVEGNMFYLMSASLAVGVNCLAVLQNKEIYVNRLIVNLGVVMATVIVLLEHYSLTGQMVLVTIGHFMILIQLCKLFEKKKTRDYAQLLAMNILLVVTTSLICEKMWFSLVVIVYLILAFYVGMVFTIKRGLDAAANTTLSGEAGPLSPRQVAWNVVRDWPGRTLRRLVLIILLPTVLVSLLAFFLVPRMADELMHYVGQHLLPTSFDPVVRLGGRKELYLSDRMIMWVRVHSNGRVGPTNRLSSRYLRSSVLDLYVHSTWKNSGGGERFVQLSGDNLQPINFETMPIAWHEIQMVPLGTANLALPYATVRLTPPAGANIRVSSNLEYEIRGSFRHSEKIRYETTSFSQPFTDAQRAFLARQRRRFNNVNVPANRPLVHIPQEARERILALAEQWCGDLLARRAAEPQRREEWNLAIARRIKEKLQNEYAYDLDIRQSDPSRDGVEDFLFHLRKGHCEYFASAMAVMCVLLDVPARVAVGFMLNEYDEQANQYVVRERDAHAWCEVYSSRTDWIILDPTPAAQRLDAMKTPWWSAIRDFFQELRFFWYQNVVGYDTQSQKELTRNVSDRAVGLWGRVVRIFSEVWESIVRFVTRGEVTRMLVKFLLFVGGCAMLIVLGLTVRRLSRRRRSTAGLPPTERQLVLLHRFMAMLERHGFVAEPGQTLRERALLASEQFTLPPKPLTEMTDLQYRWRWGRQEPTDEELQQTRQSYQTLCDHFEQHRRQKTDHHKEKPAKGV
jgi:transglutaminase-like putative cysteine protease